MASVTNPSPSPAFNRVDADRRVRHPLAAIRGTIRRYVLLEGSALAVLYVALCFWLGLLVDYVPWKALSFDWLWRTNEISGEAASVTLRVVILLALIGGFVALVALKVLRRMFKEFSDAAVALLLEKRYPRQLGDRLITAVELADPQLAKKYGYSQQMVDHTIRDAADRVGQLPVQDIFRWDKLRFRWATAILASVGIYLLAALGWCVLNGASPLTFAVRFHQTASIWAERNLFMMSSYWPTNHYLELIRFAGTDVRVPRDEDRPDVKVRWVRWMIADGGDEAPRGWRPLIVDDLAKLLPADMIQFKLPTDWDGWIVDLDDLDARVPNGVVPPEWGWQGKTSGFIREEMRKDRIQEVLKRGAGNQLIDTHVAIDLMLDWRNWTLDKIESQLDFIDAKAALKTMEGAAGGGALHGSLLNVRERPVAAAMQAGYPAEYQKFEAALAKLRELAQSPTMARTLRRMQEPAEVIAARQGESGSSAESNCKAIENRKFIFPLAELKESSRFSIVAGDYWTPWRKITLVPPPRLDRIVIDKEEPAYLYYRLLKDPDQLLKEKRQQIGSINISTTGSISKIYVPFGANVFLKGHTDRKLRDVRVAAPAKREEPISVTPPATAQLSDADPQTFTADFLDVRELFEFDFEFKDEAGVKGVQRIVIEPKRDAKPKINDLGLGVSPRVKVLSGDAASGLVTGSVYVITPDAYLLWRGIVQDDYGLAKLQFKYELQEVNFQDLFADPTETKRDEPKTDEPKKPSRPLGANYVIAGFQYAPGPSPYAFFAAQYFGGLEIIAKEGRLPAPPPRIDYVALERSKRHLATETLDDVSAQQMLKLLNVQPANRPLLAEAMSLTPEKRAVESFVERLKEANQATGFLREVMDFASVPKANGERAELVQLIGSDPAEALARLLKKLAADADSVGATRELLKKQPHKLLVNKIDLADEDSARGFDLRKHILGIKAATTPGESQKHYGLKVTIVATDNNVVSGPGVTEAGLPYNFLIVSENELLALMLVDQRRYAELFYKTIDEMERTRQSLEATVAAYKNSVDRPVEFLLRTDAVRKALRDGLITTKTMQTKFGALLEEMKFNEVKKDRREKMEDRIVKPLGKVLTPNDGGFAECEKLTNKLFKDLSPDADAKEKADSIQQGEDPALIKALEAKRPTHLENGQKALEQYGKLVKDLNTIHDAMRGLIDEDDEMERFLQIEAAHRGVLRILQQYYQDVLRQIREDLIGPGGDSKNEKK